MLWEAEFEDEEQFGDESLQKGLTTLLGGGAGTRAGVGIDEDSNGDLDIDYACGDILLREQQEARQREQLRRQQWQPRQRNQQRLQPHRQQQELSQRKHQQHQSEHEQQEVMHQENALFEEPLARVWEEEINECSNADVEEEEVEDDHIDHDTLLPEQQHQELSSTDLGSVLREPEASALDNLEEHWDAETEGFGWEAGSKDDTTFFVDVGEPVDEAEGVIPMEEAGILAGCMEVLDSEDEEEVARCPECQRIWQLPEPSGGHCPDCGCEVEVVPAHSIPSTSTADRKSVV